MKVLIIEDEHRIATSIQKGLIQEGYQADISFNGTDGLDMASSVDYDVIVLDLMLPGMDGFAVCKSLREQNIHTPILMLTAKSQLSDKLLGFQTGVDDYLTKPFAFEELLARLKSLNKRPSPATPSIIDIDGLVLNTKTYQVRRDSQNISLTQHEYRLLEYFIRNAHQILTKEQIISYVWEYDSDILPNTVEVYVKKLRNKIDLPFPESTPLLTTIRGFGYRLGK